MISTLYNEKSDLTFWMKTDKGGGVAWDQPKKPAKTISRQNCFAPKLFRAETLSRQKCFAPKPGDFKEWKSVFWKM